MEGDAFALFIEDDAAGEAEREQERDEAVHLAGSSGAAGLASKWVGTDLRRP